MHSFTLVVCSCDAYQDVWRPLFTLFERYWPDIRKQPIILCTETLSYQQSGFAITCPQLFKGHPNPRSLPWSKILKDTLKYSVTTDLVLIYLDDFLLQGPVNNERLEICLRYMEENKNIANIVLYDCPPPYEPSKEYPWLCKRSKKAPYLFTLQAGLWRRERLIHFLRDHESPWHFERWGSIRGRRYKDEFFAVTKINGRQAIFDYEHAIIGGRWKPFVVEFFSKEGISCDFSKRGFFMPGAHTTQYRRNWFKSAWNIFRSLKP